MLSVSPVSNNAVHFRAEGTQNVLEREGAFAKPKADQAAMPAADTAEKKSGSGKKVLGTIVGLVAVAAALVALPKLFPNAIKVLSEADMKNAKFMQKVGHYTAKVGEFIGKYTYEPIANLFKGKKSKEAAAAAEQAADSIIYKLKNVIA